MFKLFLKIVFSFITIHSSIFCGFAADTLVLTPTGYKPIQSIKKDDFVISITKNGLPSVTQVAHVVIKTNQEHIKVTVSQCSRYKNAKKEIYIDDQTITIGRNQKFLRVCNQSWINAKSLEANVTISAATLPGIAKIKTIKEYFNGITLYDLNLKNDHVFCVSNLNIVIHNYGIIPALWFNSAGFFTTLSQAVAGAGAASIAATLLNVAIPATCIASAVVFAAMGGIAQSQIFTPTNHNAKNVPTDKSLKYCNNNQNQSPDPIKTLSCESTKEKEPIIPYQCNINKSSNSSVIIKTCVTSDTNPPAKSCSYSQESLPNANQPIVVHQDTAMLQTKDIDLPKNDISVDSPKSQDTNSNIVSENDPLPVENPSMIGHIFRNKKGHMLDTPRNRDLLRNLVRDNKNYLGKDIYDNEWYGKILDTGKQLWAWMRNNIIRDGGLNETPKIFNNRTGLCNEAAIKK